MSAAEISKTPIVTPPANPEEGKATVIGHVLSKDTGRPMANEIVRLAEVFREGDKGTFVFDIAFSPGTRTDKSGYFILENIPAMEYVLVIGDYYQAYDIIEEGSTGIAKVWNAEAGKILDMGDISQRKSFSEEQQSILIIPISQFFSQR